MFVSSTAPSPCTVIRMPSSFLACSTFIDRPAFAAACRRIPLYDSKMTTVPIGQKVPSCVTYSIAETTTGLLWDATIW
eukprot:4303672-Prymnesium_polylepis.1